MDRVDIEGLSLSAIATWPVTSAFGVFGKLGVIGWDTHFQHLHRDKSGEGLLYGVGVGVNLAQHWRSTLQYERFGLDTDAASPGLIYRRTGDERGHPQFELWVSRFLFAYCLLWHFTLTPNLMAGNQSARRPVRPGIRSRPGAHQRPRR